MIESIRRLAHGRSDISPILIDIGRLHNLKTFVETGSQVGNTISDMVGHFDNIYSIEVAEDYYRVCVEKFKNESLVHLILGSSGEVLSSVLRDNLITEALFWLDAHGPPADKGNQVPSELAAIEKYAPNSIVIIDDVTDQGTVIDRIHKFTMPSTWIGYHIRNMDLAVLYPRNGRYSVLPEISSYPRIK